MFIKSQKKDLHERYSETGQALILGMSLDTQDNLYVVTGNRSGVYKVCKDETSSSVVDVEEVQVLCCLNTSNNELYVGAGNMGKVYKILPSFVKEGTFISNALDTTTISDWGCIYWQVTQPEGTNVTLATRSGNCEKPDLTWDSWSAHYLSSGERITSAPARFVQYKVTLQTVNADTTPAINMVSLSYLPKNHPPKIVNFTIEKEPSSASQKPPGGKDRRKGGNKTPDACDPETASPGSAKKHPVGCRRCKQ